MPLMRTPPSPLLARPVTVLSRQDIEDQPTARNRIWREDEAHREEAIPSWKVVYPGSYVYNDPDDKRVQSNREKSMLTTTEAIRAAVEQRFAQIARSPGQENRLTLGPVRSRFFRIVFGSELVAGFDTTWRVFMPAPSLVVRCSGSKRFSL